MKIPTIRSDNCTKLREGRYITEASNHRFPVGTWPSMVYLDGDELHRSVVKHDEDGDLISVEYRNDTTDLVVFND